MAADDLERDQIYGVDADDDVEYEVEPPDPAVVAADERRAAEAVEAVKKSIDIDEIYRDLEAGRDTEILEAWLERLRPRGFQFQVKHLLVLTALVAIALTLWQMGVRVVTFLAVAAMVLVGGVSLYLQREERKRLAEVDRRRQRMYAERRAAQRGRPLPAGGDTAPPLPPDELEAARRQAAARPRRFRFSLAQFLVAVTAAAVLLGLTHLLGGPANTAMLCGIIALGGLAVHAIGYEPPELVAFIWWIALLMYIGLSIFAAVWAGGP